MVARTLSGVRRVVAGLVLAAVICGVAYLVLRDSRGGPSSADRSVCAALQDSLDDIHARSHVDVVQADVTRAGEAANRGGSAPLTTKVRAARVALGVYASDQAF